MFIAQGPADLPDRDALLSMSGLDFMTGVLRLENVVYYVVVAFFFLLAATKTLEARRWR